MKKIMKIVQSSYLHLFNILSSWIEFLSWIVKSSFSTQLDLLSSTSQLNLTLFQKNFNLTWHFMSWVLDLNLNTRLDAISLLMRSCVNNALWDFAWFLCSHRCQCVISDVRYWKWAALNFSFQTILHVYLICFCMSINLVITSVCWCSVSNRDKLCASSVILFITSFSSTFACFVTQCNFSMTF